MIPPCDPTILETNPRFKKLYQSLTSTLINPDGSTRSNDAHPNKQAVLKELKDCQIRNAKKELKKRALRQVAFDVDSEVLSDEVRESLEVITLYVDSPSSPSSRETSEGKNKDETTSATPPATALLSSDIETFYSNISTLTIPLSKCLITELNDLRSIANAGTSPTHPPDPSTKTTDRNQNQSRSSYFSRSSRVTRARQREDAAAASEFLPLSVQLGDRLRSLRSIQLSQLPAARREMAATAARVFAVRTQVLERTVVLLERAKHGALSRAMKARAEHLATVAEGVEGKLNVMKLEISATIHTPEAISALNKYRLHLRNVEDQLKKRQVLAIQELKAYGDTDIGSNNSNNNDDDGTGDARNVRDNKNKSGPMREIARRYGALAKEVEEVKMEIRRLEG